MKTRYLFFIFLIFFSCKQKTETLDGKGKTGNVKTKNEVLKQNPVPKNQQLEIINRHIINALKNKDYEKFAEFIHPEKGVTFSMYAYVKPSDKHFTKEDFKKYVSTSVKFTWGERDGSGEKMVESIRNYLEKWVFKRDFTKSKFTLNEFQGHGNSLNNLQEAYPEKDFTENYIPGSEKYSGMDRNSLRFVFEEFQGKYYLIAVINDEWTI